MITLLMIWVAGSALVSLVFLLRGAIRLGLGRGGRLDG